MQFNSSKWIPLKLFFWGRGFFFFFFNRKTHIPLSKHLSNLELTITQNIFPLTTILIYPKFLKVEESPSKYAFSIFTWDYARTSFNQKLYCLFYEYIACYSYWNILPLCYFLQHYNIRNNLFSMINKNK